MIRLILHSKQSEFDRDSPIVILLRLHVEEW